ncbi:hypothetical protein B2J88_20220 [Rhodococcus sp. SRB_17]|uniref:hypothetical protein n=1 Tax=Acidovorax sp. SRB_24 TaxID=1962700 RepID=UPI00145F085F|nr:hypothetical protein [Acidovorax sp. SRB_24]NMM75377.1 hypothetical protein [Acidovorax sp. SRB_24]NMM86664.1 hypothetical protein [Rhodococcus sp. SRB_17]
MSITVRETSKGITIRTTGADAARLLAHVAAAISPKAASDAQESLPNRPKTKTGALGAAKPESVSVALKAKEV